MILLFMILHIQPEFLVLGLEITLRWWPITADGIWDFHDCAFQYFG